MTVALFTVGGLTCDNAVAADGEVHLESMGGNAVYSAAGARLWSGPVGCVGLVPRNFRGEWLGVLRDAAIDTAGVHRIAEDVAGTEWFFHRPDGSRVDQLHAAPGALAGFGLTEGRIELDDARRFEAHLRAAPPVDGAGTFRMRHPVELGHVPPDFWRERIGMHLAPNRIDAQRRFMDRGRQAGAIISFDPGHHAGSMTHADLDVALKLCDIVLPSEKELRVLVPDTTPSAALGHLAARGNAVVACKLGSAGSVVHDRRSGTVTHIPVIPTDAPDPTGAGDAYCGGFLAGWLRCADPVIAACCGTVSASFAVEGFGLGRLLAADRDVAARRLRHLVEGLTDWAGSPALFASVLGFPA